MDQKNHYETDIVHLARLGLAGDRREVEAYLRRILRRARKESPGLAADLSSLLVAAPSVAAPLREAGGGFVPVDRDTRLQLLRQEHPVILDHDPILAPDIRAAIDSVVSERTQIDRLTLNDLSPTRTLLFTGAPGVGKTLTARWLAARLKKPLLTLDLSTVISSFLGRTGANIRHVIDYAKSVDSVLLLDEFDAIAKRRDDETELGELKRLVTVLLQEIDLWPRDRLLIAASNHANLLDPAIWRRFDYLIEFGLPAITDLDLGISLCFGRHAEELGMWHKELSVIWYGKSFSDISRLVNNIRRRSIISNIPLKQAIVETLSPEWVSLPLAQRKQIGTRLLEQGFSEREIRALVGLARGTTRKLRRAALDSNDNVNITKGKNDG